MGPKIAEEMRCGEKGKIGGLTLNHYDVMVPYMIKWR